MVRGQLHQPEPMEQKQTPGFLVAPKMEMPPDNVVLVAMVATHLCTSETLLAHLQPPSFVRPAIVVLRMMQPTRRLLQIKEQSRQRLTVPVKQTSLLHLIILKEDKALRMMQLSGTTMEVCGHRQMQWQKLLQVLGVVHKVSGRH